MANAEDSAIGAVLLPTDAWVARFPCRVLRFGGIWVDGDDVCDLFRLILVDDVVKVRLAEAPLLCDILIGVGFSEEGATGFSLAAPGDSVDKEVEM